MSTKKTPLRPQPSQIVRTVAPSRRFRSRLALGTLVIFSLISVAVTWHFMRPGEDADRDRTPVQSNDATETENEAVPRSVEARTVRPPAANEGSSSRVAPATSESSGGQVDELGALRTPQVAAQHAAQHKRVDPRSDGWKTEAFAETASAQLSQIGHLLEDPRSIDPAALANLVSDDFSCGSLKPRRLSEAFRDEALIVRRAAPSDQQASRVRFHGAAGLVETLQSLVDQIETASENHVHFKVVSVEPRSNELTTTAYYQASYRTTTGLVQQRATWDCRWAEAAADGLAQLSDIAVRDFEQVEADQRRQPLFADCTEGVLGANRSFRDQLVYGLDHWLRRIGRLHGMYIFASYGIALGDVNGDGLDDLYVCQPGGLPNRFFIHNPDGTATDRSSWAGVDLIDHTSSALFVDLDNDGDQDLVATVNPVVLVFENDSTGRFRQRAILRPADRDFYGLSAADYDDDGDLDLYGLDEVAQGRPITSAFAGGLVSRPNDRDRSAA